MKVNSIRSNSPILPADRHVQLFDILLFNLRRKPVATHRAASQQHRRDHLIASVQLDMARARPVASIRRLRRGTRSRRRLVAGARLRKRRDQGLVQHTRRVVAFGSSERHANRWHTSGCSTHGSVQVAQRGAHCGVASRRLVQSAQRFRFYVQQYFKRFF